MSRPPEGRLFIDGQWAEAAAGGVDEILNPATGATLGTAARASSVDVDRAVAAASAAFESAAWRLMSPRRRGELLWRLADLVESELEELAHLETRNEGLPVTMQTGFAIPNSVQVLRYYAGWCTKITGVTTPLSEPDVLHRSARVPIGVCGLVTPWNAPLMIAVWKLAPALAAGNTVVIKPAPETPFSTLRLAELARVAGFPDGVINVVPGDDETGRALVAHPDVAKVSFTGSTAVGRAIAAQAARRTARVSLELGNKGPSIVAADADLDQVIEGSMMGAFLNSGQICAAHTRFYVHRSRFEEFTDRFAGAAQGLVMGDGMDATTTLGPLISQSQLDRVDGYVRAGRKAGATVLTGGARAEGRALDSGFFYSPTVFTDVTDDMAIAQDEIFGPVVATMPYDEEEEALARSNALDYGLSATVWSRDIGTANRLAQGLDYGTVWINLPPLQDAAAPWGGMGASGLGREMGSAGIESYTETKSIWTSLR